MGVRVPCPALRDQLINKGLISLAETSGHNSKSLARHLGMQGKETTSKPRGE